MEIRFETQGIEPIPKPINSHIPMKVDDIIYHQNPEHHRHYKIIEVKYIVDDCDGQFYQSVLLQAEE